MSAPHFFVDGSLSEADGVGASVELSAADSRHALRSLRLRPGEAVTVADGRGAVGAGRLSGERDGLALVVVDAVTFVEPPRPRLVVGLAPPKGDRLTWAIQKLAEVGADATFLMPTARSIRRPGGERGLERLAAVAREAAMQSRQPRVMEVAWWVGPADATADGSSAVAAVVVLHAGASVRLADALPERPEDVRLLVGPEGGFTDEEVAAAEAAGATAAALGAPTLRTETAAVVGAALVLARYGRLG